MPGQSGGPNRSICFRRTLISWPVLALEGMQNRCVPQRSAHMTTPYDHMSKAGWGKSSCLMCNSTSGALYHIAVIFLSKTKCEAQAAKPKSAILRVLLGVSNKIFPMDQSRCATCCECKWTRTLQKRLGPLLKHHQQNRSLLAATCAQPPGNNPGWHPRAIVLPLCETRLTNSCASTATTQTAMTIILLPAVLQQAWRRVHRNARLPQ